MPWLLAKEGDGEDRRRRDAAHGSGRAVDAARHVDRDDGQPARDHPGDHIPGHAVDRAREAGAEQRVDDQAGVGRQVRRKRLDGSLPACRMPCRIPAELVAFAEQKEAKRPTPLRQVARRDEPVTAIIAGTAEHRDGARRPALGDRRRDGGAGTFHQRLAGDAAGNRQAVGLGHFPRRQQGQVICGNRHLVPCPPRP